jgi:hypothetical protein
MSRKFIVRPQVDEQVQSIRLTLEMAREGKGADFTLELERLFQRIETHPFAYAVVYQDIRAARILKTQYILHYFVTDDAIEIFSVMHGARDPNTWRSRR